MKILDVGCNRFDRPAELFPSEEREVTRLDIDPGVEPDYVHDITQPLPEELHGRFDVVLASHVLEHLSWRAAVSALANLAACVREGGALWILVPDLEWAAREIANGDVGLGPYTMIFGGQINGFDFHSSGFTSRTIKLGLDKIGWKIRSQWRTGVITVLNNVEYPGQQIVTEAVRQ